MTEDEKNRVISLVYDAFSKEDIYKYLNMHGVTNPVLQYLKDNNILGKKECSAAIINAQNESISCLINESAHLKISAFEAGLECEKAMAKVYKIDELLQEKLQFAASFDFGYLTSRIKDCGSGMKISLRVFIPSIVLAGQFESIVAVIQEKKLAIKPVFVSGVIADFSNCIFDISTTSSSQGTEFDQMANIKSVGMLILKTERKIRKEFADNNPTVVLNFLKQSYAKAMFSLLLSYEEAVCVISAVKWGLQLKMISGVSENALNALYFRIKDGHLKYMCDSFVFTFEKDIKPSEYLQIKRLRAIVIQQAFEGIVNEKPLS